MYRVIHNSLAHVVKSLHLNGGNMRPTDGKRHNPSVFSPYLRSALFIRPLWHGRRQSLIHFRPYPLQYDTICFWDGSDDSYSQLG